MFGIKTTWITEITQVKEKQYFVDEQRIGSYDMRHHEHFIYKIDGGVIMKAIVSYKPPFGFIGSIANSLIIEKKLTEIFNHRFKSIEKLFGVYS